MKKILTFLALCLLTVEVFGQASALNPYWMKWKIQGGSYRTKKQIVVPGLNMSLSQTNDSLTITLDTAAVTAAGYSKLGQSIDSTEITDNTVSEPDLHISNGTTNGLVLKWLDASGLTWSTDLSGGAADSSTFASYIKPFGDNDDTLYWLGDTLLAASGLTSKVIFAPSVAADTLILGRDGKTLTDSLQVVRGYVDIKILTGTTAPAATYMRIYPVGDTLWAKTSDNDSFNLTRAGAGGGADTLVLWVLGAGAYPASAHRIRFLEGTGASLTATGDTSLTIATSLGTSIGTAEIEANAVDGTKIAITSQATGDIIYYNGTDWVVQGTHASNTVLHGNDAAAPTFSAVVSADITDGTVDSMDIATGAIKSAEIFNNTIIAEDIAANVITASEIATDGVGQDELANGSVGTGEIIDATIDSIDIAQQAVRSYHLKLGGKPVSKAVPTANQVLKYRVTEDSVMWAADSAGGGAAGAVGHVDWITPEPGKGFFTRELNADSNKYLGAASYVDTYGDSLSLIWQSVDSTTKYINYVFSWTLDSNWSAWGDTALRFWYKTQSTSDSFSVFLYEDKFQDASDMKLWGTASDNTGLLTSTSWTSVAIVAPTSYEAGDIMWIRIRMKVGGTAGTAYVKWHMARVCWDTE